MALLGAAAAAVGGWQAYRTRSPQVEQEAGPDEEAAESGLVGRYRLLEKIGEGGSADVYRVVPNDSPSSPPLALKLQREKEKVDAIARARFQLEIQASLSLKHPNLAEVHDWGEDSRGRAFMVSELLVGRTLRQRMREDGALTLPEIAAIIVPLGQALEYLHEHGMIHRDIKPDNIFLTRSGTVKLMDLGIIKSLEAAAMTRPGTVVGTPHYLSPEQIHGESAPSSDQYGLGVMLFEMLAGQRPFKGTPMEIIEHHLYKAPPRLAKLRPGCAPSLDSAIDRMLAKDPESRYCGVMVAVHEVCKALAEGEDDEDLPTVVVTLS